MAADSTGRVALTGDSGATDLVVLEAKGQVAWRTQAFDGTVTLVAIVRQDNLLAGRPFISQGMVARHLPDTGSGITLAVTIDRPVRTLVRNANGDLFFATDSLGQQAPARLWRVTPE